MAVTVTTHNGGTYEFTKADDFAVDGDLPGVQILKDGETFAVVRNFETVVIEDSPEPELKDEPELAGDPLSSFEIAEAKVRELQAELENWKGTANRRYWAAFGCNLNK